MSNDEILETYKQHLEILELQAAKFGDFVPPYITIEINDLKRKIADLDPTLPKRQAKPHNIWVVDAFHRGDFVTINEAIAAASDGDEIRIKPGVYEETLHITKVLEILGDGNRDEIEIRSSTDDVIKFEAKNGRIADLKVRQFCHNKNCISVVQMKHIIIEDCDISNGDKGIFVEDSPRCSIRGNIIHDSISMCVQGIHKSEVRIENNDIFGSFCGIDISVGCESVIVRNYIRENDVGIGTYSSRGIIENNDIFNNNTGIEISHISDHKVRDNRIKDSYFEGIKINEKSGGTFTKNQFSGNGQNWNIEPTCLPNVIREGNIEE